jgi:DNA helicase-2/ATP-dependent DNA helicase PcrA
MKNTLFISSAGSGKTTLLIKEALSCSENVLITTFNEENEMEIKRKILELNIGIFPSHITVQTWFSFLI